MASIALEAGDVIVGVDTHKDEHAAAALDSVGGDVGDRVVPATIDGYAELLDWATAQGRVVVFGVEGCGSYGIGLARFLRRHGQRVVEVNRPARKGERRMDGKSDLIDARHAAKEVLAGAAAAPKTADGMVESIRLVKIARDSAVKAHSAAMITLKAVLVTATDDLRGALEPLTDFALVTACAALLDGVDPDETPSSPDQAMRHALGTLARRWLAFHEEIKAHNRFLKALTRAAAPQLLDTFGIGPDIASELLIAAGDNSNRIRSEAAFAKLCGVCPIPTGSGRTNGRHRLNRGGNRQANAALYRCVVVRMRWHEPTIAYVARRTAEGLSKKEIIRCLKRYLAREIYALLPHQPAPHPTRQPLDDL